jgi:hypothetical protein
MNGLRLEDGKLIKKDHLKKDRELLPRSHLHSVFGAYHANPAAGHFGIKKTLAKIRETFYWKGK